MVIREEAGDLPAGEVVAMIGCSLKFEDWFEGVGASGAEKTV